MRYLLVLDSDLYRSVNLFSLTDLKHNLHAADVLARSVIGEYNPHEWDSSLTWDMQKWSGHELQLFLYGRRMATRLEEWSSVQFFDDLINAYEGDPATAMTLPSWVFDSNVIEAHVGYLLFVADQDTAYSTWRRTIKPQALPVPLVDSLAA